MEGDPAQVVVALAGLAMAKPLPNGSVIAAPVKATEAALLIWMVTRDFPPVETELGVNVFEPVMLVLTVNCAVRLELSVAPWVLVSALAAMVFV